MLNTKDDVQFHFELSFAVKAGLEGIGDLGVINMKKLLGVKALSKCLVCETSEIELMLNSGPLSLYSHKDAPSHSLINALTTVTFKQV